MEFNNNQLSPWKRFRQLLKLEKKDIFQVIFFAIFEGIVALSLPLGIQTIINLIQGAQVSTSWIVLVGLVTLAVIFAGILKYMQMRVIETIQQRLFARVSFELAYRFPKMKLNNLNKTYLPELANRFFDTVSIQKGFAKLLLDAPSAVLQVFLALILLAFYHPFFIVFGGVLIVLIIIIIKFTLTEGLETSLKESKYKYKVAYWLEEIARSVVGFKLSGGTSLSMNKTDKLVYDYIDARESHFKILVYQFSKMIGFKAIITAGLLLVGGYLVLTQEMNIGQFVAAEIIIILIINSVEKLILSLESFYDVVTSIEKIGQVLDEELEKQEGEDFTPKKGITIEMKNVSYHLPEFSSAIIKNISLKIEPQDRIIIEGESGSGKSIMLKLLAGVIEPTEGNIIVNSQLLKSIPINTYRKHIGFSISEEMPFEGTLRENITFGDPSITDEDIYEVFDKLFLMDFYQTLPSGLSTTILSEGKQLPHFISKKILLARAILKKPQVMILEDPLKKINDEKTQKIIEYLCAPERPWSLIIISENDQWKNYCNRYVFLQNGALSTHIQ